MPDERSARPSDGAIPFDDDVPWHAWSPAEVTERLSRLRTPAGRPVRWAVAGGWALDLHLGRVTREHEDLEIVVLNDDVPTVLSAFDTAEWRWSVPTEGWLHPLGSAAFGDTHQTWLWSETARAFVLDVFRDEHDGETWICRRDEAIRLPWRAVTGVSAEGTPYLAPEIVLLFKAKHARPKDAADLRTMLPALDERQLGWLRACMLRVHPGHDWLELI